MSAEVPLAALRDRLGGRYPARPPGVAPARAFPQTGIWGGPAHLGIETNPTPSPQSHLTPSDKRATSGGPGHTGNSSSLGTRVPSHGERKTAHGIWSAAALSRGLRRKRNAVHGQQLPPDPATTFCCANAADTAPWHILLVWQTRGPVLDPVVLKVGAAGRHATTSEEPKAARSLGAPDTGPRPRCGHRSGV